MDTLLAMMKKYPLVSSWRRNTWWSGFISVNDELLRLTLEVPNFPLMNNGQIHGDDESTRSFYAPFEAEIKQLLSQKSLTVVTFLDTLTQLLGKHNELKTFSAMEGRISEEFYTVLMKELEEIGFENIVYLSETYREIHVKVSYLGRGHTIKYYLQSKYPNVSLKVNADFPITGETVVLSNRLVDANRQALQQITRLDEFWDEMENFDTKVNVIDPVKPNRSHCYRRILISDRISIQLEVNPLKPKAFPEISFMGPEKAVEHFECILEKNCKKWNEEKTILNNLEFVLETDFPEKNEQAVDGYGTGNCIICLTYELSGSVPERRCECGVQFHHTCLNELFKSEFSTNIKRTIDCPVCGMELKIQVIAE